MSEAIRLLKIALIVFFTINRFVFYTQMKKTNNTPASPYDRYTPYDDDKVLLNFKYHYSFQFPSESVQYIKRIFFKHSHNVDVTMIFMRFCDIIVLGLILMILCWNNMIAAYLMIFRGILELYENPLIAYSNYHSSHSNNSNSNILQLGGNTTFYLNWEKWMLLFIIIDLGIVILLMIFIHKKNQRRIIKSIDYAEMNYLSKTANANVLERKIGSNDYTMNEPATNRRRNDNTKNKKTSSASSSRKKALKQAAGCSDCVMNTKKGVRKGSRSVARPNYHFNINDVYDVSNNGIGQSKTSNMMDIVCNDSDVDLEELIRNEKERKQMSLYRSIFNNNHDNNTSPQLSPNKYNTSSDMKKSNIKITYEYNRSLNMDYADK